jgi:hypothetical protein
MKQKIVLWPALLVIVALCACSTTYRLTMTDVGYPLLENTPLDVLSQQSISYRHLGSERFDSFFKESATLYAGFVVGRNLTMDVTKNLKSYARSRLAKGQLSQNAQEFLNGRDPDSLSSEETVALLQLEKKQGAMTRDEFAYMGQAILNLGGAALPLVTEMETTGDLIKTGTDLMANMKDEFSLFGVPKFWIMGGAMKGTKESLKHLKEVGTEAPGLAKEIAVLAQGVNMMLEANRPAADSTAAEPAK